jgi:hypothetical protein
MELRLNAILANLAVCKVRSKRVADAYEIASRLDEDLRALKRLLGVKP